MTKPRRLLLRAGEKTWAVNVASSHSSAAGAAGAGTERVSIGEPPEATLEVRRVDPGRYVVSDGVRSWEAWVTASRDTRTVFVDGKVFELEQVSERPRRRKGGAGTEVLTAPMPATVVQVLVRAGQPVRSGETLLKLEAMKMELPLKAAADGTVRAVHCREGELVQPGVALVELS